MAERQLAEIEAAENAPSPQFPALGRLSGGITNGNLVEPA